MDRKAEAVIFDAPRRFGPVEGVVGFSAKGDRLPRSFAGKCSDTCQAKVLQVSCQSFSLQMVRDKKAAQVAVRAINEALLSAKELADDAGISYAAVASWRAGTRSPDPDTLLRLADAIAGHAVSLERIAERLRKEASKGDA